MGSAMTNPTPRPHLVPNPPPPRIPNPRLQSAVSSRFAGMERDGPHSSSSMRWRSSAGAVAGRRPGSPPVAGVTVLRAGEWRRTAAWRVVAARRLEKLVDNRRKSRSLVKGAFSASSSSASAPDEEATAQGGADHALQRHHQLGSPTRW
jgi:hypothetical protein